METKKAVAIILSNSKQEILLQQRTSDALRAPNKWGCFGGGLEEGETPLEAVKRECFEELEYKLIRPRQFLYKEFPSSSSEVFMNIYYFTEPYDPTRSLHLHEGQDFGWFGIEEASALDATTTLKLLLQELKQSPVLMFK